MVFDNGYGFVKLLQNRSPEVSHLLFLKFCLKNSFEIFFGNVSGQSNVSNISKRQSSLNNNFYDRNQTFQAETISNIVRID